MKNKVIEILKEIQLLAVKRVVGLEKDPSLEKREAELEEFADRIETECSGGDLPEKKRCMYCEKLVDYSEGVFTCYECSQHAQPSNRIIAMEWWNSISTDMKMMWTGQYYPGQSHNLLIGSEIEKMFKSKGAEDVSENYTKATQKQDGESYHIACQNCGTTKKPLQMIPFRNSEQVVGLLMACDSCKGELYGQRFDREEKFYPIPEISEGEITDILTKYSTTKLSWIKSAHGKNQLVIDPMDYHKIAKALSKGLKPVSEERIEEIFDANSSMGRAMSYNGFKAALKELNNK